MSKFKCYSAFEITVNVSSNHAASIFHKLRKQKTQLNLYNLNVVLLLGLTRAVVN